MNRDYYIAGEYAVFGGVHAFPVQLVRSIHIIGDIMRVGVQSGCNTEIELHDYYIDVSKETLIKIGEFVETIKKEKEGYNAHIEYNSSNGMTLFPRITRYELELCSFVLVFVNILLIAFLLYFISVH
nr:MAG TPA: hypothetical protein [Bacteriophage sp.]